MQHLVNEDSTCFANGTTIRHARRSRGLTQKDLARLLGITQARISQWELGMEEVPRRQIGALLDIFENRKDKIGPFLERLIRRDSLLSIQSGDGSQILKESRTVLDAYGLEATQVENAHHGAIFEANWKATDPVALQLEELLAVDYERDISLTGRTGPIVEHRVAVELFSVDYTGYGRVLLRRNRVIRPTTGESMRYTKKVLIQDLDVGFF